MSAEAASYALSFRPKGVIEEFDFSNRFFTGEVIIISVILKKAKNTVITSLLDNDAFATQLCRSLLTMITDIRLIFYPFLSFYYRHGNMQMSFIIL